MPDYNITLQFYGVTLGGEGVVSAEVLARAFENLAEDKKLDAITGLKNLPNGGTLTDEQIMTALVEYSGDQKIPQELIDLVLSNNALNFRGYANPYDINWKTNYTGLSWDFIICIDIPESSTIMTAGDWLIQLQNSDEPGMTFAFSDTTKWMVLKMSNLDYVTAPTFRLNNEDLAGTESVMFDCQAEGEGSLAVNQETISGGVASLAHGYKSQTERLGERAVAAGCITDIGDMQYRETLMYLTTNTANATQVILPQKYMLEAANKTYSLKIWIVARLNSGESMSFMANGLINMSADYVISSLMGGFTILSSPYPYGMTVTWLAENYELKIFCSGLPQNTVNWHVRIESLEVST